MIYGFIGIASIMIVNQLSYMGLLYMIRHRYDQDMEFKLLGLDMTWIYKWLNIPYNVDIKQQNIQSEDGLVIKQENIEIVQEYQNQKHMDDYNINADIKLAKLAYNAMLYPRIGAALFLTFMIGTPILRVAMWIK